MSIATTRHERALIETDPDRPGVHITRDFRATKAQLLRAHTDPELFRRWIGPERLEVEIDQWDCTTLGRYRYVCRDGDEEPWFRGTFPEVGEDRLVQTFCYEGMPESILLERMEFEELGDGWTRLRAYSQADTFEARDGMVASGMDSGVHEGYAKLDRLLESGDV